MSPFLFIEGLRELMRIRVLSGAAIFSVASACQVLYSNPFHVTVNLGESIFGPTRIQGTTAELPGQFIFFLI